MTVDVTPEELVQAERDLASLAQAIAHLYDTPAGDGLTHLTRQRAREELEARLDAVRARALALQLALSAQAHAEVVAALDHWRAELVAAEEALQEVQLRVGQARARVQELVGQEQTLREQRQTLRQKLAAGAVASREASLASSVGGGS
jgi:hypothetical protein